MASRLTLVILAGLACGAQAQEIPDLIGKWTYTVSGLELHERCGQGIEAGELVVERKIAARAYRGKMRAERSFEECQGSNVTESSATIRVKDGNLVTVDYDEEGWEMERLRFVDGALTGDARGGISTRWVRAVEQVADEGPTPEQLADLETFLQQVEPDLSATLKSEYFEKLRKSLWKSGLSTEDSVQIATLTIDRMTSCMLDMMRDSVMEQEIPIDKILQEQNVAVVFDPRSVDMRANTCVQDAAWNAGVPIR
jgi:hypothetical protein